MVPGARRPWIMPTAYYDILRSWQTRSSSILLFRRARLSRFPGIPARSGRTKTAAGPVTAATPAPSTDR